MTKTTKRIVAFIIAAGMLLGALPMTLFASIPNWEENNVVFEGTSFGTNGYYNVISKKDYVLVPGAAVESEIVLNNASGTRRQVLHVIEVDPSNPDVSIVPGYNQIDKDLTDEANWSHKELTEMAKYYEDNLGYNIVGGMNTDLYYDTYAPRILVYNGKNLGVKGEYAPSSSILYVFQDAEGNVSCEVKAFNRSEFDGYLADGTLLHAVGVSFGMVVNDGELVSKTEERTSAAAARSMVGVKEDGTLVICMNDGRGANNSVGFCNYEEGEAMLALGCKWAANCDGGGSSTFISKRVGEDELTMRSVPCDGAQRPTAHGIFIASNVAPTGVLDVVNVNADYDIFAPKTTYTFDAEAIDTHGYAMDMPADATWALSDTSFGTIANGTFVSNGKKGEVDVQVYSGGKIVGTKTIMVADPANFSLVTSSAVVPYSTADKVRTITLPIVAMIGEANVYIDTSAVSVSLSDTKAGSLDGFKFTATSDTSIAGVDVTITYGETKLVYAIEFGKGSEIIFDFEDGDKAGFVGYAEAKKWCQENNVTNGLFDSPYPHDGQMDPFTVATTFVGSAENGGQYRNGSKALAWRFDNTDPDFEAWSYYYLYNIGESVVLRDVANDKKATALGMWVYIPEDAFVTSSGTGFSFQAYLWVKNSEGAIAPWAQHFMFTSAATGKQTNLNSATNADIPESRWVYASVDLTKYDYVCTAVATSNATMSPAFIRSYAKPKIANEVTFYIDDITLDYSSAVDDRVLPTITNPTYSTADTAVSLENGATVNGNKVAFSATVSDNIALDFTTGKIFVDGVEVKSTVAGGALSSAEDVVLAAGQHTVVFEIKDELGNPAKLTRTFTVSGDAVVELSGHNNSGEAPKAQSVYYVDINVADLSNVTKLVAVLKLQTANTWETKGAVVAKGFKATFDYNEFSQLLTVTVEADGTTKATKGSLVSIPVRIWTYNRYDYLTEKYDSAVCSSNKPAVNVDCEVVYGIVDGNPFGGSINIATELTTISSPYHTHDEKLTVQEKAATCTENGYTGRTFCATCQSVVDWGTVVETTGHGYVVSGDILKCPVDGEVVNATGLVKIGEKIYCLINSKLVTGWQNVDGKYVYANATTKEVQVGTVKVSGITYNTDEMGFVSPVWVTDANGMKCSYGPRFYTREWVEMDGAKYYFGTDSYLYTGLRFIVVNRNNTAEGYRVYRFAEDGKLLDEMLDANGIISSEIDGMFYVENGKSVYGGLMLIDGAYYYARTSGEIVVSKSYWPTKTNGLLPAATYTFGADGKMLNPPVVKPDPTPDPEQPPVLPDPDPAVKNGIVSEDGKLWWYVDGVKTYGGLMLIDGAYYYARSSGEIVTNKTYWPTKTNYLLPAKNYTFGADGKMLNAPVVNPDPEQPPVNPDPTPDPEQPPVTPDPKPEVKNGIVSEDGKLWWYVDGVKTYGGLMLIDGAYYYARTSGEIVTNKTYWPTKTNDLLPAKNYTFGADGKMQNPPV